MNEFSVVLLSDRPDLKHQCCELLGEEWKRSDAARLHGLSPNSKDLPDSVLLVEDHDVGIKVVGHSRVSRVLEDKNGCWIASVIITQQKRGQGLGKFLMVKTEEYAKILGFTTAYLNTHDKQGFYEHLGYSYCAPVSPHKGNFFMLRDSNINHFHHHVLGIPNENEKKHDEAMVENVMKTSSTLSKKVASSAPPPPPPPPPQPSKNFFTNTNCFKTGSGHYWMKKYL